MARTRFTTLSMKNPFVMYGLYGVLAYVGYQWWTGKPMKVPFLSGEELPEPNVSAFPTRWLP